MTSSGKCTGLYLIKNFVLFMKQLVCSVKGKPSWTSTECALNSAANSRIRHRRLIKLGFLSQLSCPTIHWPMPYDNGVSNRQQKYRQLLAKRLTRLRNPTSNSKPSLTTHELLILSPLVLLLNLRWEKPVQDDSSTQAQPVNFP